MIMPGWIFRDNIVVRGAVKQDKPATMENVLQQTREYMKYGQEALR